MFTILISIFFSSYIIPKLLASHFFYNICKLHMSNTFTNNEDIDFAIVPCRGSRGFNHFHKSKYHSSTCNVNFAVFNECNIQNLTNQFNWLRLFNVCQY